MLQKQSASAKDLLLSAVVAAFAVVLLLGGTTQSWAQGAAGAGSAPAASGAPSTAAAPDPCQCPPDCPPEACELLKRNCKAAIDRRLGQATAVHQKPRTVFDLSCLEQIGDEVSDIGSIIPNISVSIFDAAQGLLDEASRRVCEQAEEMFAPIRSRFNDADALAGDIFGQIANLGIPGVRVGGGGDDLINVEDFRPELPQIILPGGTTIDPANSGIIQNIIQ